MGDDSSDLQSKLRSVLVSVGAWGGTAAIAAVVPGDASTLDRMIAGAGLAGLAAALDKLPDLHRAFSRRNWFRMLFGFAKRGENAQDASRVLNAALMNDDGQATLFEVLRRMNDAADPANVLPAIGKLLREYIEQKKPSDAFFRGAVRTLLDLMGPEVVSLQYLLRAFIASRTTGEYIDAVVTRKEHFDFSEQADRVRITVRPQTRKDGYDVEEVDGVVHGRRLFYLLLTNDLAVDPGVFGGMPTLAMARATAARLLALFDVESSGPDVR